MPKIFIEARRKGRPEGSSIKRYVVENHADDEVGEFETQDEANKWANSEGHIPRVARVRHLNDKKKPITGGRGRQRGMASRLLLCAARPVRADRTTKANRSADLIRLLQVLLRGR